MLYIVSRSVRRKKEEKTQKGRKNVILRCVEGDTDKEVDSGIAKKYKFKCRAHTSTMWILFHFNFNE